MRLPRLLTTTQAAALTGLDVSWIRRNCVSGRIPARKYGPEWLMERKDALAFAAVLRPRGRRKLTP